jgi:signal transduction histidine kinase
VAHDFNNLMTAVGGYAGMVSDSLDENDPRRDDLQEVHRAATRAGELTQQLLAFARRRVIEPQTVDIGELVRGFARMLAPLLGGEIRLTVKIADSLPSVRVDPLQLEQVLVNLAANARDAMPLGGELAISVEPHRLATGDGVRIAVRDTGAGMAPEVLAKIWEPFFTTKPQGKGTGLGLATVHGIMHQAGGDVQAESTVGVGTTIGLLLPVAA